MNNIGLDILVAVTCGCGGAVVGWLMHALHRSIMPSPPSEHDSNPSHNESSGTSKGRSSHSAATNEQTTRRLAEIAERLRGFATTMAADVDAHQSRVQAVNHSLLGRQDSATPQDIIDSVNELIEANEQMQHQLNSAQRRIQEQSAQLETAEKRAQTDPLTMLANRRVFDETLAQHHLNGAKCSAALGLIDLDHFKKVNDIYGHRAGDEVLRHTAAILNARLKPFGTVARFGGEEFAIVIDNQDRNESLAILEQARTAIGEREILFEDQCLRVNSCLGVAFLEPGETTQQWLQRADEALYHSKENGRNCGHWMQQKTPRPMNHPTGFGPTPSASNASDSKIISDTTPVAAASAVAGTESNSGGDPASASMNSSPTNPQASNPAESATITPSKPTTGVVASLPAIDDLETKLSQQRRGGAMTAGTQVLAIRLSGKASPLKMRSLLQVVRASSRNVDEIGGYDDHTILLVMPSADQATALARGKQVCSAAQSLRLGTTDAQHRHPVAIGVVESSSDQTLVELANRAATLANETAAHGDAPVAIAEGLAAV
ncbi:Response regulator PleD [Crateriforma conspicua]|uniref:diguanylate cyclase n=2 Tax=Crateriforma conspicua TaxID=2527996 RepID=A0A5C5YAF8_9PLAN|nr:Response regulator PleD [Crateriforma conspicua]TWT70292.1 Response regulator PleD [Crateriforma conspicua]